MAIGVYKLHSNVPKVQCIRQISYVRRHEHLVVFTIFLFLVFYAYCTLIYFAIIVLLETHCLGLLF